MVDAGKNGRRIAYILILPQIQQFMTIYGSDNSDDNESRNQERQIMKKNIFEKQVKALIFDMDGVIMDSMGMWKTLAEDYLRTLGIEPGPIFDSNLQTMNLAQGARFMKEKFGIDKTEEQIIEEITAEIKDFYINEGRPKEGAAAMLSALKEAGMRICMATATERPLARAALKRNGLLEYFEFIITNTDVGKGKDDPAIFKEALNIINGEHAAPGADDDHEEIYIPENINKIEKEETMIVEDSLIAIRTATGAGFKACGVYDEHESILFPEIKAVADVTVMSLHELPNIIC